jgi:hypothetical protein
LSTVKTLTFDRNYVGSSTSHKGFIKVCIHAELSVQETKKITNGHKYVSNRSPPGLPEDASTTIRTNEQYNKLSCLSNILSDSRK